MLNWLEDLLRDYLDFRPEPEDFQSQRTTRRGWLMLGADSHPHRDIHLVAESVTTLAG
jgi:hypothetical protein